MRTIDFAHADKSLLPNHWELEESETTARLAELYPEKANLEIWHYPAFPFRLGLCIDASHLLIAFPAWDVNEEKLADRTLDYRYFAKNQGNEYLFDLFEN